MKFRKSHVSASVLTALALLAAAGCDKASPVAPQGSFLTISATPTKVGLTGSSTITVVGRKPTGSALDPGTEIRFSVDKGTVTPAIVEIRDGVATATFRADGRPGVAKVSATTGAGGGGGEGGGTGTATIDIQVGETAESKPTVLISASPNSVPVNGTSEITVIARNADGSPLAGQQVILTTTLGRLRPERPTTGADGTATSTLSAGDLSGTATITAIVGASDPKETTVTIRNATIAVQANPATVPTTGGSTTLTAFVTDIQGLPVPGVEVTFLPERGTLANRGTVTTDSTGVARNTLTLTQQDLADLSVGSGFTVIASTPSGSGSTTITVR